MSWVVENFIKNSLVIRANIYNAQQACGNVEWAVVNDNSGYMDYNSAEADYDDLLTIEIEIKKLHSQGILNDRQLLVVNEIANGSNFVQVASKLGLHRHTVAENFGLACEVVSKNLGEHFTVDGYIDYLISKRRLDSERATKLRKYIETRNYTKYWRNNGES